MGKEELIKRIMEEVKDQELKEELLRIVAKTEDTKLLKRIEHRLKAQDMLSKRDVLFTAPTDRMNKIRFWDEVISGILGSIFSVGMLITFLYLFAYDGMIDTDTVHMLTALFVVLSILAIAYHIFYSREGYNAYKKLKEEEKKLEEE